ncbi:hypothetical protein HD554DRAFT_2177929 [Boletus coccyginus]|nr:hypothetical protein HD554DRAFT_2177929 [Boletus coccyginus]
MVVPSGHRIHLPKNLWDGSGLKIWIESALAALHEPSLTLPLSSSLLPPPLSGSTSTTMSGIVGFFNSKFPPTMNPHDQPSDPLSRFRFALKTIPGSHKYIFMPATCAEILSELYNAFWGPYAHLFLPLSNSSLPMHATLGQISPLQVQAQNTQLCWVVLVATYSPKERTVSSAKIAPLMKVVFFAVAASIPALTRTIMSASSSHNSQVVANSGITWLTPLVMPLIFFLTFDSSPDEPSVPSNEADLQLQPTADSMQRDQYSIVIWNDDKHSFDEVIQLICNTTNHHCTEATVMACAIDEHGREIIDINTNMPCLLEIAQTISKIEINATIRHAYDTFRELGTDTLIIRKVITAELHA